MIVLTTLKGDQIAINDALLERVEDAGETRVVLTTGTRYIVSESLEEIVQRCRFHQAEVQALAQELQSLTPGAAAELRLIRTDGTPGRPDTAR